MSRGNLSRTCSQLLCGLIFDIEESSAKWDQAITRDNYRGFIPMGFFTPNDGSGHADRYEGYKLHHEVAS